MTIRSHGRCDLTLNDDTRCPLRAEDWIETTTFFSLDEPWPLFICRKHHQVLHDGQPHRIVSSGPDRRKEYAKQKREGQPRRVDLAAIIDAQ